MCLVWSTGPASPWAYIDIWFHQHRQTERQEAVQPASSLELEYHLFTPTLMSSTTTSSTNFQSILDAAFISYSRQTGIDIASHPSADKLQDCNSPEDVIRVLLERQAAFEDYRERYHKLVDFLRPIVKVVHAFSGILGEAAGLVRSTGRRSSL